MIYESTLRHFFSSVLLINKNDIEIENSCGIHHRM